MYGYWLPGPAANCKLYSISAQLSKKDITDILNRINERRNFVALGQSRTLPQAANMRKIVWSDELAMFAQRWADQCDSHKRPDREDQCRDLPEMAVGQNIATVLGSSPGLDVKSFIDMWYMQTLDYKGSVTYYNRSKDTKTNYFTQLIWAESDTVGCGRARFVEHLGNRLVERLVCNFAPKGNLNGKPVYAMGYPATQCPEDQRKDEHYRGLCSKTPENQNNRNNRTTQFPPASSVLRILISNNTAKQEIDPIKNNLKYIKHNENETDHQRNQKIRHVIMNMMNSSYEGNKAFDHQPQIHLYNNPAINFKRPGFRRYQQEERGHSRVYHDHEHKNNDILPVQSGLETDFRRYEFITEPPYPQNDLRKHNQFLSQCTRRALLPLPPLAAPLPLPPPPSVIQSMPPPMPPPMPPHLPPPLPPLLPPPVGGCCLPNPCCYNRCAKAPLPPLPPPPCVYPPPSPPPLPVPLPPPPPPIPPPPPMDPCPHSLPCMPNAYYQTGCQCLYDNVSPPIYPNIGSRQDEFTIDETRKSGGFHYYDLFPNLSVRSGDDATEKSSDDKHSKNSLLSNAYNKFTKSLISHRIKDDQEKKYKIKDALSYFKYNHKHECPYTRASDGTERKKRQSQDDDLIPFWQIENSNFKHQLELKAMRYTTITNKRTRNLNKISAIYTEPITISLEHSRREDHITEKILSFDELMHLRKFNDEDDYYALRTRTTQRKATAQSKKKTDTTKTVTTTKKIIKTTMTKNGTSNKKNLKSTNKTTTDVPTGIFTINTPFSPKKHCTRILTCTWTIATVTAQDGSIYNKGGNIGGSRTPPGYVEGCTRTSTCTRVFLDRNKVTEPSHDGRGNDGGGDSGVEDLQEGFDGDRDEDYCERRSLNVEKKSDNRDDQHVLSVREPKSYTHSPFILSTSTLSSTAGYSSLTTLIGHCHDLPYPKTEMSDQFIPSESTTAKNHNCLCYGTKNARTKRDVLSILQNRYLSKKCNEYAKSCENDKIQKYAFSYGDLYYMVLKKIMKTNRYKDKEHTKVCHCSSGTETTSINKNNKFHNLLFLFIEVVNLYFSVFIH